MAVELGGLPTVEIQKTAQLSIVVAVSIARAL